MIVCRSAFARSRPPTGTGASSSTGRWRRSRWPSHPTPGCGDDYELKLNSYDLAVDIELYDAVQRLRFEHPEVKAVVLTGGVPRVRAVPGSHECSAPGRTSRCWPARRTATRSTSASSPTRPATRSRTPPPIPARRGSPRSTVRRPAAATSWPWRATRSSSSTIGPRPSRCPKCRCSPCSPAPAGSPASSTSATSAATSPTCSPRGPRVCKGQQAVDWGLVDADRSAQLVRRPGPRPSARPSERVGPTRRRGRSRPPTARPEIDGDELRYDHVERRHRPRASAPPGSPSTARQRRSRRHPTSWPTAGADGLGARRRPPARRRRSSTSGSTSPR